MQQKWFAAFQCLAVLLLAAVVPAVAQEAAEPDSALLDYWREQLHSKVASERAAAIEDLQEFGPHAAAIAPALIEVLGDQAQAPIGNTTTSIGNHAHQALVKIGPAAADVLLGALNSKNRLIRIASAEALGELHESRAIAPLVEMLGDVDRGVAHYSSSALREIGEPAIDPLIAATKSENVLRRSYAIAALGNIRHSRVVKPVAQRLYDQDKEVRQFAKQALHELASESPYANWRPENARGDSPEAKKARKEQNESLRTLVADEVEAALGGDDEAARLAAAEFGFPSLIGSLTECLRSGSPELRQQAVRTLAVTQSSEVFAPLVAALKDPVAQIRVDAANGLCFRAATFHDRTMLAKPLLEALDDTEKNVRRNAIEALGQTGPDKERVVVQRLQGVLKARGEEAEVVGAAIDALINLGGKEAADDLVALLSDKSLGNKAAAALASFGDTRSLESLRARLPGKEPAIIAALGRMKDRDSVEPLVALLADQGDQVRGAAIGALGTIGDRRAVGPLVALLDGSPSMRGQVARALAELKDPRAIPPMIAAIHPPVFFGGFDTSFDRDPMDNPIAWPLYNFGLAAVEPLAAALKSPNEEVRSVAAGVLENLISQGDLDKADLEPAINPLAAMLTDSSQNVRFNAAMALGHASDKRASDVLVEMIANASAPHHYMPAPNPESLNAAYCLGRLKELRTVEPLTKLLNDERPQVRAAAARALSYIRNEMAIDPLLLALTDENAIVRTEAAQGLGGFKAAATVEPLVQLLGDPELTVRAAAAGGLGRIGDARAIVPLEKFANDADFNGRLAAAIALVRLNDARGIDLISKLLKHDDEKLREQAVTELLPPGLHDERLIGPLAEALNDPSIRVRLYAAPALSRVGGPAAIDALLAKLSDRENLQHILGALSRSKDERALAVLVRHLDDSDPQVRSAAAYGIGAFGSHDGVEPLLAHVHDRAAEVRVSVLHALALSGGKEVIEAVVAAMDDDDPRVRTKAERSLRKLEARILGDK